MGTGSCGRPIGFALAVRSPWWQRRPAAVVPRLASPARNGRGSNRHGSVLRTAIEPRPTNVTGIQRVMVMSHKAMVGRASRRAVAVQITSNTQYSSIYFLPGRCGSGHIRSADVRPERQDAASTLKSPSFGGTSRSDALANSTGLRRGRR